jgi:5,10-methylene-tetrahydrofolate dehydrogenase/methenyl tetrahydrofolate cyclohydrolase
MARILDGKRVREEIQRELKPRVARLVAERGRPPGLAVILDKRSTS